jgi:hypothetical protein
MATNAIAVEIYTTSHRILGRIDPGRSGLYSFLNIPTSSNIEIQGAILSRLHQPNRLVARYPTLWLVKQEISAVLLSSRIELGATAVSHSGYTSRDPNWVHVILGGYELRGMIEISGKFNPGTVMFEGEALFFPMYDAQLNAVLFPNMETDTTAMLFNRRRVDAIGLMPRKEIPTPPTPE